MRLSRERMHLRQFIGAIEPDPLGNGSCFGVEPSRQQRLGERQAYRQREWMFEPVCSLTRLRRRPERCDGLGYLPLIELGLRKRLACPPCMIEIRIFAGMCVLKRYNFYK